MGTRRKPKKGSRRTRQEEIAARMNGPSSLDGLKLKPGMRVPKPRTGHTRIYAWDIVVDLTMLRLPGNGRSVFSVLELERRLGVPRGLLHDVIGAPINDDENLMLTKRGLVTLMRSYTEWVLQRLSERGVGHELLAIPDGPKAKAADGANLEMKPVRDPSRGDVTFLVDGIPIDWHDLD